MKTTLKLAIAFIVLGLSSCKKDETVEEAKPKDGRTAIKLNEYMPAAKIDSGIVIWEINGQVQQEKLQLSNDTLFTAINKFNAGRGRLTVQLFSQIERRQRDLQWEQRVEITLKEDEPVHWQAPMNYEDPAWFPRVIMIDNPSRFTAIVGLRPADPYFLLKNVPVGFKIELDRGYYIIPGGAISVGKGYWRCNTVCTDERGMIEDRQFFSNLPAQINGRAWKMLEVGIGLFNNTPSGGPGFYFNDY